jgi:transcriptional regulator with XRE-family HTH domain
VSLRECRKAAGLTQAKLAEHLFDAGGTLRNLERGATEPLLPTTKKLADALGVRLVELAG